MHIIIHKLPENSRCGFQKCEDSQTTSHKSILCAFVDFIINFILHLSVKCVTVVPQFDDPYSYMQKKYAIFAGEKWACFL